MGNINCLPLRRNISYWFRSRDKTLRKRADDTADDRTKKDVQAQWRKFNQLGNSIKSPHQTVELTEGKAFKNDTGGQTGTSNGEARSTDKEIVYDHGQINPLLALEPENAENESESEVELIKKSDYMKENTHSDYGDQRLMNADRLLSSIGVCAFEDEIVDPPIDDLAEKYWEDDMTREAGDGDNKAYEDDLDDQDSLNSDRSLSSFGVCVYDDEMKPRVKAIERIKEDHVSLKWRKDPIPEEERRGSLRDLSWSRHMRRVEKQVQIQTRLRTAIMARFPQTTHVSGDSSRFSKRTDTFSTIVEEDEDDVPQNPRLQQRTHGLMDTVVMETDRRYGERMIRRHTSYFNLPAID